MNNSEGTIALLRRILSATERFECVKVHGQSDGFPLLRSIGFQELRALRQELIEELDELIVSQIHEHGKVVRGWLGVLIQPVSDDVAMAMKLESSSGALVADVMADSPAKKAGIQRGDVILKYDSREVTENDDLPILVADTPIGKVVTIEVLRGGKKKEVSVTIQALDEQPAEDVVEQGQENKLGLTVQDITPDLAKSLDIDASVGVLVSGVAPGSAAEDSGLERGDVVLEVASKAVNSKKEFNDLTKDMEKGKPLLLLVKRGENTIFLTLKYE